MSCSRRRARARGRITRIAPQPRRCARPCELRQSRHRRDRLHRKQRPAGCAHDVRHRVHLLGGRHGAAHRIRPRRAPRLEGQHRRHPDSVHGGRRRSSPGCRGERQQRHHRRRRTPRPLGDRPRRVRRRDKRFAVLPNLFHDHRHVGTCIGRRHGDQRPRRLLHGHQAQQGRRRAHARQQRRAAGRLHLGRRHLVPQPGRRKLERTPARRERRHSGSSTARVRTGRNAASLLARGQPQHAGDLLRGVRPAVLVGPRGGRQL